MTVFPGSPCHLPTKFQELHGPYKGEIPCELSLSYAVPFLQSGQSVWVTGTLGVLVWLSFPLSIQPRSVSQTHNAMTSSPSSYYHASLVRHKIQTVYIPEESGLLLRAEEVSLLALPWAHFLVRTMYGWVVRGAWLCNASKCWSEDGLGILGRSQPSFLSAEIWGLGEWGNYGQECHQGCCRQAEVGPHSFPPRWEHENLSAFTAIWAEGRAQCLTASPSGKCPVPYRCGIPHHSGPQELSEDLLWRLCPHRTNPRGRWSEAWEGWWREFTLLPCVILCDLLLCLEQRFFRDVQKNNKFTLSPDSLQDKDLCAGD